MNFPFFKINNDKKKLRVFLFFVKIILESSNEKCGKTKEQKRFSCCLLLALLLVTSQEQQFCKAEKIATNALGKTATEE